MTTTQAKHVLKMAHAIQKEVDQTLKKKSTNSDLLTAQEVARILRVDDTTVRRWMKQGTLEAVVLPGIQRRGCRIKRETLDKLLGSPAAGA